MHDGQLLIPGQTCWRLEHADRFACIIDAADYFHHAKTAMLQAQRRIVLVGWDFDTRMSFEPRGKTLPGPNRLGAFLRWLLRDRPSLEIYVLKWNMSMVTEFQAVRRGMTPVVVQNWLSGKRVQFAIDRAHPVGSVQHQKIMVIDDSLAFCGGIDMTVDRWDTSDHVHRSHLRRSVTGRRYSPRHDVSAAVDGPAARAIAEQARRRWQAATSKSLAPIKLEHAVWPDDLEPAVCEVDVGIARTLPAPDPDGAVREVEALNLAAIAAARHIIYIENQYMASRKVAEALAARLCDPEGPEVVIVLPRNSESWLEQQAMDGARLNLLQLLWAADDHGRLGVYWPVTDGGEPIYVHSKVLVIDDQLLRIGTSNLNNRSMGFDSECDLAVEADPAFPLHDKVRRAIVSARHRLVGEHLGLPVDEFEHAMNRCGSLLQAIESLRGQGKTMRRFEPDTVAGEDSPLAENDLLDPDQVPPSPVRRMQRFIARLTQ
jgi:phosphatidylserine/phosphatidylglycerophosphate/cardiolipin synthase-like enzyme